jgi:hypothetical protein
VNSALAISATGRTVPSFFIFCRVNFHAHSFNGVPADSNGDANPTGLMKAEYLVKFVEHLSPM